MSIRQRLGVVLVSMAALMVTLSMFFVVGGPIMVKRFARSMNAMDAYNLVRDYRSALSRKHSSLKIYLLVGESQGLNDFRDFSRDASNAWEALIKSPDLKLTQNLNEIKRSHESLKKTDEAVVDLYQRGEKAQALKLTDRDLFPQYEKLFSQVAELEKDKRNEAAENFQVFRKISERGVVLIVLVASAALVIALFLLGTLYRAVMRPLVVLRTGALEFGAGHWDHRIQVPAKNEFDTLAQAFNTMAENVRQLQLQTIHMERMSTVGQLAGGVAHELNNPLTGVLGQTQLLLDRTPSEQPEWAQLKKIEQAALRCKRIVRGLLDFSRPQEGQFQPTNINELLLSTLELCEADIKAGKVHVHKELDLSIPPINVNGPQLEQVFLNLITNALHAMDNGGSLTLKSRVTSEELVLPDRRIGHPPQKRPGPWVEITVTDVGCGIRKEDMTKIFEPFFTTKDIGKGTGLGLAISLGIVRTHSGEILVESDGPGKGTTFRVVLPLSKTQYTEAIKRKEPSPRYENPAHRR